MTSEATAVPIVRADGRAPDQLRPISITRGWSTQAEGSALIEFGNTRVLTYSGDTDSCAGLEEAAKDADLFLCEAAFEEGRDDGIKDVHLTGKRAGEAAAAAGARRLLLTHIPVWTSQTTVMAEARPVFGGDVAVAVAGVHYTI